jgi:hypothetical protein
LLAREAGTDGQRRAVLLLRRELIGSGVSRRESPARVRGFPYRRFRARVSR